MNINYTIAHKLHIESNIEQFLYTPFTVEFSNLSEFDTVGGQRNYNI